MRSMLKILALLLLSQITIASNLPDFPFIVITGEAKASIAPDRAKISFTIMQFDKDPEKALELVLTRGQETIKAARDLGIPLTNILSKQISKNTVRARNSEYNQLDIQGYEVSQSYTIDITHIDNYTTLADKLVMMKNITDINASFDISTKEKVFKQLTKEAAADANRRANDLSDGMGVKVDSVFAVNEDTSFDDFFATFGLKQSFSVSAKRMDFARESSSNMFIPKTIEINKTINVIYKLKT